MWSFLSFLHPFLHLFHLPCLLFISPSFLFSFLSSFPHVPFFSLFYLPSLYFIIILPSFPFSFLPSLPPFQHHLIFLSFHFPIFFASISASFYLPFFSLFHLPFLHISIILPSYPTSSPLFFLPSISSSSCLLFLSLFYLPFLHFSIILPSHPSSSPLFFLLSISSSSCLPLFPLSTFFPQTRMDGQSALPDFGAYTPSLQHYAQRESNHIQKLKGSVT